MATESRFLPPRPWSTAQFLRFMRAHDRIHGAMFDPPQVDQLERLAGVKLPRRPAQCGYVYVNGIADAVAKARMTGQIQNENT